jgi:ABC-type transport system substrate-binding protein
MSKNGFIATVVVAAAAVGFTAFALNDNKAAETVANSPRPTVTVTAPAKPAPTATVTATATVAQVPQSCLDALDNADTGFTYAGQIMNAAAELDADTMNAITDKLTALAPTYNTNKAACRAAGGQ